MTIYGARTVALDPKTHHIFSIATEQNESVGLFAFFNIEIKPDPIGSRDVRVARPRTT